MRGLLCSLCVIAILATATPAFAQEIEGELFFWASSVECETPGAKPAFNFDGEMVCGCVKDGSFTGPCYDLGYKVKEMPQEQLWGLVPVPFRALPQHRVLLKPPRVPLKPPRVPLGLVQQEEQPLARFP